MPLVLFLPKKVGGEVFKNSGPHNFYIQAQNFSEIIGLESTHRDLSKDMLHDMDFPNQF